MKIGEVYTAVYDLFEDPSKFRQKAYARDEAGKAASPQARSQLALRNNRTDPERNYEI